MSASCMKIFNGFSDNDWQLSEAEAGWLPVFAMSKKLGGNYIPVCVHPQICFQLGMVALLDRDWKCTAVLRV